MILVFVTRNIKRLLSSVGGEAVPVSKKLLSKPLSYDSKLAGRELTVRGGIDIKLVEIAPNQIELSP